MRICLFEDQRVRNLEPLTATRPVFALHCGLTDLATKQLRHFGGTEQGVLIRTQLAELFRMEHSAIAVNDSTWLQSAPTLFVNGRWLPPAAQAPVAVHEAPHVGLIEDEVAYALVPGGLLAACPAEAVEDCMHRWKTSLPCHAALGDLLTYPWDLVEHNPEQIRRDFASREAPPTAALPAGLALSGTREQLYIAPSARVEAFVAVDVTGGPVVIDEGAVICSFTRLEGPCYVGAGTQVTGAKIRAGTTLGNQCRVGGEVEASIFHGYSNKYHDGFLGHAYVGEWVNLGAGTHNSDLRNDYGEVSVPIQQSRIKTGLSKVGCFIGDHAKTGLGTLINTGSNIGVFANLLPAGMLAPKFVPSFTNLWKGTLQEVTDLSTLFVTAAKMMQRRGRSLTEAHIQLYRQVFEETAFIRRRAIQEADRRKISRTA
jgi:UDP-N-acetylglucosamine diphosphorylase/glucosamine-1-phosphate N-acetyltransferase